MIDSAQAGDIVALVGLKNVQTGHTLVRRGEPGHARADGVPGLRSSPSSVTPKDKANAEKLGNALGKMVQEDPSFHVEVDEESGETILKGMGELHLDIKVDILQAARTASRSSVGKPQVAYRETITQARSTDSYTHKKQTGGSGQYAKIEYTIEPRRARHRLRLRVGRSPAAAIPKEFIPAVEKGFKISVDKGPLAGYPCVDVKVTLDDGGFHAVDSSQIAFEVAAKAAYRQTHAEVRPAVCSSRS